MIPQTDNTAIQSALWWGLFNCAQANPQVSITVEQAHDAIGRQLGKLQELAQPQLLKPSNPADISSSAQPKGEQ